MSTESQASTRHDAFASAVIRVRECDANAVDFLVMVHGVLSRLFAEHELICVVSGFDDKRAMESVRAFKNACPKATASLVVMGVDQGAEAAMSAGVDLAVGDYVYEFDSCFCDFSPATIGQVFEEAVSGGHDVVAACPPSGDASLSSRAFYRVFNHFSELGTPLRTERFRLVSRRAINRASSYGRTVPYRKALYATSGLGVFELEYQPVAPQGLLSPDRADRESTAADALILFTDVAFKLSVGFAILMACVMAVVLVYVCVIFFGQQRAVAGWATTMGVLSVGLCAVFIILAIVIKYLDVVLRLVFRRQRYLVAGIERL